MAVEVARLREAHVAEAALVRLFSSMGTDVFGQRGAVCKTLRRYNISKMKGSHYSDCEKDVSI